MEKLKELLEKSNELSNKVGKIENNLQNISRLIGKLEKGVNMKLEFQEMDILELIVWGRNNKIENVELLQSWIDEVYKKDIEKALPPFDELASEVEEFLEEYYKGKISKITELDRVQSQKSEAYGKLREHYRPFVGSKIEYVAWDVLENKDTKILVHWIKEVERIDTEGIVQKELLKIAPEIMEDKPKLLEQIAKIKAQIIKVYPDEPMTFIDYV